MKAVVLSGIGMANVAVRDVSVPVPGPEQILARVDAAGVCTSILKILQQGPAHTYFNGWDPALYPVILGDEGSLTVVAVGAGLRGKYTPGQRLAIQPAVDIGPINHRDRYRNSAQGMTKTAVGYTLGGNLAQYILVQEEVIRGECLLALPEGSLPYFAVSMAEPVSCVVSAQDRQYHLCKKGPYSPREPRLGMLPGGTTVVVGAGPMGLMHVELAIRFGPRNLVVCDPVAARLDRAVRTIGPKAAAAGIRLVTVTPESLKDTVAALSGGAMADDVVFAVGIRSVQQSGLDLLGKGGVANFFGGLPKGSSLIEVDAIRIHYDEIRLVGSSGGAPSDMRATLGAFAAGDMDPGNYVYGIGGLRHAPEVLQRMVEGKVEGKVILYPNAEVPELVLGIDHWDAAQEDALLEEHLFG